MVSKKLKKLCLHLNILEIQRMETQQDIKLQQPKHFHN